MAFNALYVSLVIGFASLAFIMGTVNRAMIIQGAGLAFLLAIFNVSKAPESDLLNYIDFFYYVEKQDFLSLFNSAYLSIRPTEFVFTIYVWFLTVCFDSALYFTLMSTALIYGLVFYGVYVLINHHTLLNHVSQHKVRERLLIIISFFFIAFAFITFSLSGHLIRQYLALAVFFLGLCYQSTSRPKVGSLFFLMAIFVHNSVIVLVALYYSALVTSKLIKRLRGSSQVALVLSFILLIELLLILSLKSYAESQFPIAFLLNDGSIPLSLVIIDVVLFCSFLAVLYVGKNRMLYLSSLIIFILMYTVFLAATYDIALISLRYYFLMDFLRCFLFVFIVFLIRPYIIKKVVMIFSVGLVVLPLLIFGARYEKSPWVYYHSASDLISVSVVGAIDAFSSHY